MYTTYLDIKSRIADKKVIQSLSREVSSIIIDQVRGSLSEHKVDKRPSNKREKMLKIE